MVVSAAPFDLWFPAVEAGFQLLRAQKRRAVRGGYGPAYETEDPPRMRDIARIWSDHSGGGGIAQAGQRVEAGYSHARNACTRFPGVVTPSGALTEVVINIVGVTPGEIVDSFEQDDNLYLVAGRYIIPISSGTDPGPITSLGSEGKDLGASSLGISAENFGSSVYLGTTGTTLWKKPSGGAWTNTDPATGVATLTLWTRLTKYLSVFDDPGTGSYGAAYVLVGTVRGSPRKYQYSSAEPLTPGNLAGGTGVKILNETYPVNALVASNRRWWALTPGTVVHIDQRNEPAPLNESYFSQPYSASRNGEFGLYHNGWLYVTHSRGIDRVDVRAGAVRDDVPGWCDWRVGLSAETPVVPRRFSNMIALDGYIVVAAYNGTDSYVNFGRDRSEINRPGPGPLAWYLGEYYLPGERITHIRATSPSSGNPRFWICSVDGVGAVRVRWASMPYANNPYEEILANLSGGVYTGSHLFCTAWSVFESNEDGGDASARKIMTRYDVASELVSSQATLTIQARAENGDWVPQGTGITSPRASILPVEPLVTGLNIGVRIDGVGTTTKPAVLRSLRARWRMRRELANFRHYTVQLGRAMSLDNGTLDDRDPQDLYAELVALQSRGVVTMRDELGITRRVIVEEGLNYYEDAFILDGSDEYERLVVCEFDITILPSNAAELALDQSAATPGDDDRLRWTTSSILWGSGRLWGE